MLPMSFLGRVLAVLWLAACTGALVFAFLQRGMHDMPIAFMWLMVFLSFPIGLLGAVMVGGTWPAISATLGFVYQPFWDLLPYWTVLVVLGYVQWFVGVPYLVRKVLRVQSGT